MTKNFAKALLAWFDVAGRKHLPWQKNISPYSVWISEIMLQQTQVATVIPYFEKFLSCYPNIKLLANAELDSVLHLWTGLGYYARARNLHKAAQIITYDYKQVFPNNLAELITLPGIGRSTAGAILSIAFQIPTPILDGNVKRVLARYYAIDGHPGEKQVEKHMWQLSSECTPSSRCRDYTQAIMDLGATLCTRSQPKCSLCPIRANCIAYQENKTNDYPVAKRKAALPIKHTQFLILQNEHNAILLEKRPPVGIWSGLWSFPEYQQDDLANYCKNTFNCEVLRYRKGKEFRHTFSHFHLNITPIYIEAKWQDLKLMETNYHWHTTQSLATIGLSSPVKKILQSLDVG